MKGLYGVTTSIFSISITLSSSLVNIHGAKYGILILEPKVLGTTLDTGEG